jgi:hypothetical protein
VNEQHVSLTVMNDCVPISTDSLQFFFKMAVLICMTIFLSTLYSIFWLMALLALVGPENTTGDVSFIKRFVRGCLGWDQVEDNKAPKKLSEEEIEATELA